MRGLDEVNGGGWGCIYSLQPLPSRCSNSTDRRRSTPLVRTVCPCTSMSEIATVSSNGYINGYKCIKCIVRLSDRAVTDGLAVHPIRFARTLKYTLPNPSPSGFSGFSTIGRSAPEAGRSTLGLGRCSLLLQTVLSVNDVFCSVPIRGSPWCRGRSAARARTVRA
jgi:hypothetical protein